MSAKLKKLTASAAVLIFWIAAWQIASVCVGLEFLLPSPLTVLHTLIRVFATKKFLLSVVGSILRITAGFLAGVVFGTLTAVVTVRFKVVNTLLSPLLHTVKAAPVASFIILALVWLRTGILPAFISFLMVLPLVWSTVSEGIRQTDRGLVEMAHSFRFGKLKTLLNVYIPSVKPFFLSACTTALGFAWKSGIAAEVICTPEYSVGGLLQTSKMHLETAEVFAYTVVVIIISVLLEKLLLFLLRRRRQV